MEKLNKVKKILSDIYGDTHGGTAFERIAPFLQNCRIDPPSRNGFFSEKDVILITYGDSLRKKGEMPLTTLRQFAGRYLSGIISMVHLLPFFPFSSDDGFSVTDFFAVNPHIGTWDEVRAFAPEFELMFDFVINHFSSQSQWFQNYLSQTRGYEDFAIAVAAETDLSMVTRPRTHPLLTPFQKKNGETVHLWTTFSTDQIDFNYKSIDVLEKIISILIFYVQQGASVFRLDAIAYLWKQIGTPCIHLPNTHNMVKLFRAILDLIAPGVMLLTETNVPHSENISYFGDGKDEAQMVYNFTLPPLLFYTFTKNNAGALTRWAADQLKLHSDTNTFLNFTASHDGIGVRPLEGILPLEDIQALIEVTRANCGQVSYKMNGNGTESPYELNITYVDALRGSEDIDTHVRKFMASQAIQYTLPGVPATYIHSLLGSCNWEEGYRLTGRARTINRQPLDVEEVIADIEDPTSLRGCIFSSYLTLIKTRTGQSAFHPNAWFEVPDLGPNLFAIKRWDDRQTILALTNVTPNQISADLSQVVPHKTMIDLLTGNSMQTAPLHLAPYQYIWLTV